MIEGPYLDPMRAVDLSFHSSDQELKLDVSGLSALYDSD